MTTTYTIRRLGRLLEQGNARIAGTAARSTVHEGRAWIVEDLERQETYHVDCCDRPTWGRYVDVDPAEDV